MKTCVQAKIVGRVQGVGFRPTVYRYATQLGLHGFVRNDPTGVTLEVEGEDANVGLFFHRLTDTPPPQAVIESIEQRQLGVKGYQRFEVVDSEPKGDMAVHVPPDLAICDDCLHEMRDPTDRRHAYPFINCTNCGPRFTIIRDLPYDRGLTSMAEFAMCEPCAREYHDPLDRRFHAQPDACPECGPRLSLPVDEAVRLLQEGAIVAIKSLGGFHLACDAFNAASVARLRERKNRPGKALAVMFTDLAAIKKHCVVSDREEIELLSPAAPIVVLKSKSSILQHSTNPDSPTIGVFLPYTPLHHLLMEHFEALVMTSGNLTDEPIASEQGELPPVADAVLSHNRTIVHKCDDSVLRLVNEQRQFLRRARGFVPNAIRIAKHSPEILAVGGELKNTFCLVRDGTAFLSQHIGDLKDYKTYDYFAHEITEWQRLMRVEPVVVAHDLHPAYLSTRYAKCRSAEVTKCLSPEARRPLGTEGLIPVQHHHAHIASVMAEHDLHEPVIGVALDGTGYGTDGTIWGGEVLVADRADFERVAHFKHYRLPGGDKAVEEPWRMAVSVLETEGRLEEWMHGRKGESQAAILPMLRTGFNSPLTSSAGRLFDAVAAILDLCDVASYEAQAAIRLEAVADPLVTEAYPFAIVTGAIPWTLDIGRAIDQILDDKRTGKAIGGIAARFHNTVAAAVVQTCRHVRSQRNLQTVALSGGVFQNALLLQRIVDGLQQHDFRVYTNTLVPPNDGGLAFGQAAVAAERMHRLCV